MSTGGLLDPPGLPAGWREIVRRYQRASPWKGAWQLVNTLGPYVGLWVLMYFAALISYWLVVPLALLAGLFLGRTFVIFHDCTHSSLFRSNWANEVTGVITGLLAFTPFHHWRWEHSAHHASAADLDRRGTGDIWTLTVQEYLDSPRWRRFAYRVSRNPIVLFVVAPLLVFVFWQRIPKRKAGRRERCWVHATNLLLVLMATGLAWLFGVQAYLVIQFTVLAVMSALGVWLFYVQHQFEDVYWDRRPEWDFERAALEGSSFYKLPKILQWFTGNIGFHHVHHLSPRIPNYELERAHRAEPMFHEVKPLTLRASLKSLSYRLWDEGRQKLTGYNVLKEIRAAKKG